MSTGIDVIGVLNKYVPQPECADSVHEIEALQAKNIGLEEELKHTDEDMLLERDRAETAERERDAMREELALCRKAHVAYHTGKKDSGKG